MKGPSILRVKGNPKELIKEIRPIISKKSAKALELDIIRNVKLFYQQAENYYEFAKKLPKKHWRHSVSRLYYSAFSGARAIRLHHYGQFSEDVSDHKKIIDLPDGLANRDTYKNLLKTFRLDRNLCDYDAGAEESDLVNTPTEWQDFTSNFINDVKIFLNANGVRL